MRFVSSTCLTTFSSINLSERLSQAESCSSSSFQISRIEHTCSLNKSRKKQTDRGGKLPPVTHKHADKQEAVCGVCVRVCVCVWNVKDKTVCRVAAICSDGWPARHCVCVCVCVCVDDVCLQSIICRRWSLCGRVCVFFVRPCSNTHTTVLCSSLCQKRFSIISSMWNAVYQKSGVVFWNLGAISRANVGAPYHLPLPHPKKREKIYRNFYFYFLDFVL